MRAAQYVSQNARLFCYVKSPRNFFGGFLKMPNKNYRLSDLQIAVPSEVLGLQLVAPFLELLS